MGGRTVQSDGLPVGFPIAGTKWSSVVHYDRCRYPSQFAKLHS